MGKGDQRSKKGKRVRGSFGVSRPRTTKGRGAYTKPVPGAAAAVAEAPKPAAKKKAAPAKKTTATKKASTKSTGDKLTKIEGIGPKLSEVLAGAGIDSFAKLAEADVEKLKGILEEAGSRYKMFNPTTWPEQAALAAADKWDELKTLQEELDGGKRK